MMRVRVLQTVSLAAAAILCVALVSAQPSLAAVTLADDGQAKAVLVLPKDAAPEEKSAAEEIQSHIEKISGAKLETISEGENAGGKTPILIGRAAPSDLDAAIQQKGKDACSFALVVDGKQVALRGLSPTGTRIAACELLEQLGVRWFMPGELGTVIPQSKSLQLQDQKTIQTPAFATRWTTTARSLKEPGRIWELRVRMGGPNFPSSHGISLAKELVEPNKDASAKGGKKGGGKKGGGSQGGPSLFEEHPEYYSLINGERKERQLCVSNPEVLKMAITATKNYFRQNPDSPWIGMGPNDGGGMCECDKCKALDGGDFDPFHHGPSMTDRYVGFFNKILEGIKDEFPDKKIAFYAYASYQRPPVKVKPDPKIVPAMAVITLCRIHGMGNPICPEKSYEKTVTAAWGKILPEVYNRGYWFNLADPGLAYPMIGRLKTEVRLGKELGIKGWRVETIDHLSASAPAIYVAAKLMWDDTANVDAIMQDFYQKFFGPAASPMQQYIETMDNAITHADYHTGCSWDIPLIYTADVRKQARAALDEAAKLAPAGAYAQRVAMYQKNFDYTEAFITMIDRRMANDYVAAKKAMDKMDVLREDLLKQETPQLEAKAAESYLTRFFRKPTDAGYQRVTNGNQMVAGLKTQWDFTLDPERIGDAIGLWQVANTGGNWEPIRSDMSWSDQGLRYYKGLAWYRQSVKIPADAAGKRMFLWFGGVDEKAQVWVNGKDIGTSQAGTFAPFELDATDAIQPGKDNLVVVLITNDKVNELGTGGIVGPAMFYAPKDGKNAKVENGKAAARDEGVEVIAAPDQPAAKEAPKDAPKGAKKGGKKK